MSVTPAPMDPGRDAPRTGLLWRARCHLDDLAHGGDPRRTATALALGVFLSFSPFLGLQVLIGVAAAFALRLSRVAMLVGLCANLPWIMLPWYAITTATAAALLGVSAGADLRLKLDAILSGPIYQPAFWGHAGDLVAAFFWPFVVGPTTGAAVLAAIAYVVGLRFLLRRRQRRHPAGPAASAGLAGDAEERTADRHVHDAQRARL